MAMTEAEKKVAYLQWINQETGQNFVDDDSLPALIDLALEKLLEMDANAKIGIEQISQGGRTVSLTNCNRIPEVIIKLISPYRKVKW